MKVLYLSSDLPWPVTSGCRSALHNHLMEISQDGSIQIEMVVVDDAPSQRDIFEKELRARNIHLHLFQRKVSKLSQGSRSNFLRDLFSVPFFFLTSRFPIAYRARQNPEALKKIKDLLAENEFDLIVIDHINAVALLPPGLFLPTLYISHNAESVISRSRYRNYPLWHPFRFLFFVEYLKNCHLERFVCSSVDRIVCISSADVETLKTFAMDSKKSPSIACCPERVLMKNAWRGSFGGKDLLFVGPIKFFANQEALFWTVEKLMPALCESAPDVRLLVAGTTRDEFLSRGGRTSPHVQFFGFVSEAELDRLYQDCDLLISPTKHSSGIKMKVLDAISHGTPIAGTPESFSGIDFLSEILRIDRSNVDKSAKDILSLLQTPENLKEISRSMRSNLEKFLLRRKGLIRHMRELSGVEEFSISLVG